MSRLRKSDLPSRVAALPRQIVTSCDGCGFDKPWIVETKDRYGLRIAVLVCPRCTLISQSSRLTPEAAALFYAGMYRPLVSTFHGSLVSAEAVEREGQKKAAQLFGVLSLFGQEANGARWIDIGGGTGVVAAVLARMGLEPAHVVILDPSAGDLKYAKTRNYSTLNLIAEDPTGWTNGSFGLLLSLESLDHTIDLPTVLRNCHAALRDGGLAFITVPDCQANYVVVEGKPRLDLQIDHTYYFTGTWAERTAGRYGFTVERRSLIGGRYLLIILRKTGSPQKLAEGSSDPSPADILCYQQAEELMVRVACPVCLAEPPTWRGRLYRAKRGVLRGISWL